MPISANPGGRGPRKKRRRRTRRLYNSQCVLWQDAPHAGDDHRPPFRRISRDSVCGNFAVRHDRTRDDRRPDARRQLTPDAGPALAGGDRFLDRRDGVQRCRLAPSAEVFCCSTLRSLEAVRPGRQSGACSPRGVIASASSRGRSIDRAVSPSHFRPARASCSLQSASSTPSTPRGFCAAPATRRTGHPPTRASRPSTRPATRSSVLILTRCCSIAPAPPAPTFDRLSYAALISMRTRRESNTTSTGGERPCRAGS